MRTLTAIIAFTMFAFLLPNGAHAGASANIYFDAAHDTDSSDLATLTDFATAVGVAGHSITEFTTPITEAALDPYDILMVHDPEMPLTAGEITEIQNGMSIAAGASLTALRPGLRAGAGWK